MINKLDWQPWKTKSCIFTSLVEEGILFYFNNACIATSRTVQVPSVFWGLFAESTKVTLIVMEFIFQLIKPPKTLTGT